MRRPLIGLTVDGSLDNRRYESKFDYAASVDRAGGVPMLLPYRMDLALIPDVVDRLDGLLLTGGDDLDPALYGEEWHPQAQRIDPDRQRFELALLAEAERRRMPTMGICLGCQVLNVHRGGSLVQFLPDFARPSPIEHRRADRESPSHPVKMLADSVLASAIGRAELIANTYHKQAISRPGKGLRIVATAPDGVVEAVEDASLPLFAGVQWHPERLIDRPEHLAIFRLLVEKSAR